MAKKVDESYKLIAGERGTILAIIMGVVFILAAVLRHHFFPRAAVPTIIKLLVVVWFLLAFIQQQIIIAAFTRSRSAFLVRITHILLCISFIPIVVSAFTMEEHFTLNNVFTRYLMDKYPTDEPKVFKIMLVWAIITAVLLLIYLCIFLSDSIISKIQWKVNIIMVASAVISFCASFPVVLAIPVVIIINVVGIAIAIKLATMLPQAIRDARNAEKVDLGIGRGFEAMMDFLTGEESGSSGSSGSGGPGVSSRSSGNDREIRKLEAENKISAGKIKAANEGYNRTFSDKRSQNSAISTEQRNIAINNKKIEKLKGKKG